MQQTNDIRNLSLKLLRAEGSGNQNRIDEIKTELKNRILAQAGAFNISEAYLDLDQDDPYKKWSEF